MTIQKLCSLLKNQLSDFEAKQIIKLVLDINNTELILNSNQTVEKEQLQKCLDFANKREEGIPLYQLFGECEFYGNRFFVDKNALIPRQDTELLVDISLDIIKNKKSPKIIDLCAGTGCVGISVANKRRDSEVLEVELFDKTFDTLTKNVQLYNALNITAKKADALSFLPKTPFDLVVCNPPYISVEEKEGLSKDVLSEPHTALFASENGLLFYRKIAENFSSFSDFDIAFEIGYKQAQSVSEILQKNNYENIKTHKDLCGNDRVVTAKRD